MPSLRVTARVLLAAASAAAIAVGTAACGAGDPDGAATFAPAAAPALDPAAAGDPARSVSLAAEKSAQETYRVSLTVDPEMSVTGTVDPVAGAAHLTVSMSSSGVEISAETITIGDDLYMRFTDGPFADGSWRHMTAEGLGDAFRTEMVEPTEFLDTVSDVERVDEHTYTGLIEMPTMTGIVPGMDTGDAAPMPFTLVLDDRGRLSTLTVTASDAEGGERSMVLTMSDYGLPVDITAPPADEVTEGMDGLGPN